MVVIAPAVDSMTGIVLGILFCVVVVAFAALRMFYFAPKRKKKLEETRKY